MANNKITLKLDGIVPLELYNQAIAHLTSLVLALTDEISGQNTIQWTVTELRAGSAFGEITGYADPLEVVEKVVNGYAIVGQSLAAGKMIPYSQSVEKAAIGITSVLNGKITAVHFGVDMETAGTVYQPIEIEEQSKLDKRDFGVVEGIVRSIADRPKLTIGLYDDVLDKRIDCYLESDRIEQARNIWLKRVRVVGMIKRNPETGRAIDVRDVNSVELLESKVEGAFLSARGALGWEEGDEPAEVIIRRLRDGI